MFFFFFVLSLPPFAFASCYLTLGSDTLITNLPTTPPPNTKPVNTSDPAVLSAPNWFQSYLSLHDYFTYTCEDGYENPPIVICTGTDWQPVWAWQSLVGCTLNLTAIPGLNPCPELPLPVNGYWQSVTNGLNHASVRTIGCNAGYVQSGTYSMTCLNGTWNPPDVGVCVPAPVPAAILGDNIFYHLGQVTSDRSAFSIQSTLGDWSPTTPEPAGCHNTHLVGWNGTFDSSTLWNFIPVNTTGNGSTCLTYGVTYRIQHVSSNTYLSYCGIPPTCADFLARRPPPFPVGADYIARGYVVLQDTPGDNSEWQFAKGGDFNSCVRATDAFALMAVGIGGNRFPYYVDSCDPTATLILDEVADILFGLTPELPTLAFTLGPGLIWNEMLFGGILRSNVGSLTYSSTTRSASFRGTSFAKFGTINPQGNPFCISFWLQVATYPSVQVPVLTNQNGSNPNYFGIFLDQSGILVVQLSGDISSSISAPNFPLLQWNHIMFRRGITDISNNAVHTLWINGIAVVNQSLPRVNIGYSDTPLTGGGALVTGGLGFVGNLGGGLRYWERMMSDEELVNFPNTMSDICAQSRYFSPDRTQCLHAYPAGYTHYYILSPYLLNGLTNFAFEGLVLVDEITSVSIVSGISPLDFSQGVTTSIPLPSDATRFEADSFLISFWLIVNVPAYLATTRDKGSFNIFSNLNNYSDYQSFNLNLYQRSLILDATTGPPWADIFVLTTDPNQVLVDDGAWHNIMIRRSSSTISILVDGVEVNSTLTLSPVNLTSISPLIFSNPITFNGGPGPIAGILIYQRDVLQEEIDQIARFVHAPCIQGYFLSPDRRACIPAQCTADVTRPCYQGNWTYDVTGHTWVMYTTEQDQDNRAWCPYGLDGVNSAGDYVGGSGKWGYTQMCKFLQPAMALALQTFLVTPPAPTLHYVRYCDYVGCPLLNRLPCTIVLEGTVGCGNCDGFDLLPQDTMRTNDAPSLSLCLPRPQPYPIFSKGAVVTFLVSMETDCSNPEWIQATASGVIEDLANAAGIASERLAVLNLDCFHFNGTPPTDPPRVDVSLHAMRPQLHLFNTGYVPPPRHTDITLIIYPSVSATDPTPREILLIIAEQIDNPPELPLNLGSLIYASNNSITNGTIPIQDFLGSSFEVELELCWNGSWSVPSTCPTTSGVYSEVLWESITNETSPFGNLVTFVVQVNDLPNAHPIAFPFPSDTDTRLYIPPSNSSSFGKGFVQFFDQHGTTIGGPNPLNASGGVTFQTIDIPIGVDIYKIKGGFNGDAIRGPSFTGDPSELLVIRANTSVFLSANPVRLAKVGQTCFFVVVVEGNHTFKFPTGEIIVRFVNSDGTPLSDLPNVNSLPDIFHQSKLVNGQTSWNFTFPVAGTIRLRAFYYNRDGNFVNESASNVLPYLIINATSTPSKNNTGNVSYLGGSIIANPRLVMVLWGKGKFIPEILASKTDLNGRNMQMFYEDLLRSNSYFNGLQEYRTKGVKPVDGTNSTNQVMGTGGFVSSYHIYPIDQRIGKPYRSPLQFDRQIQISLSRAIDRLQLPAPVLIKGHMATIYAIHFPKGLVIQNNADHSETCAPAGKNGTCAYNGNFNYKGISAGYLVLPDLSPGSGCELGCGASSSTFLAQTAVAGHELFECITSVWENPQWIAGPHIDDFCPQDAPFIGKSGHTFLVQRHWSNLRQECIYDNNTLFTLSVSVPGLSVDLGDVATITLSSRVYAHAVPAKFDIQLSENGIPSSWIQRWGTKTLKAGAQTFLYLKPTPDTAGTIRALKITINGTATKNGKPLVGGTSNTILIPIVIVVNNIRNGDFEFGLLHWTNVTGKALLSDIYSESGDFSAWLGFPNLNTNALQQNITINARWLSFWYYSSCGQILSNVDYSQVRNIAYLSNIAGKKALTLLNVTCVPTADANWTNVAGKKALTLLNVTCVPTADANWTNVVTNVTAWVGKSMQLILSLQSGASEAVTYYDQVTLYNNLDEVAPLTHDL